MLFEAGTGEEAGTEAEEVVAAVLLLLTSSTFGCLGEYLLVANATKRYK